MLQLLCHLYGDFVLQNNYLANEKVKNTRQGYFACLLHTVLYHIPFVLIDASLPALAVMFLTHFLIDKYRLAKYVLMVVNWRFNDNWGFPPTTAPYIAVWILFIVDNILHVTINFLSLKFL